LKQADDREKYHTDDLKYFIGKIEEIISCDNGEGGLKHYIEMIDK
jgi:hypothetical protein